MPTREVNGFQMNYEDRGQGEVLLFQHGWLSTLHVWDGVIPHLEYRYRCIAVDTRGCGQSERTKEGHTMQQYADDVLGLAKVLEIGRFTMIGHSMGGVIATYAALQAPDMVERLVYVASTPSADLVDAGLLASIVGAGEPIAAGDRDVTTRFLRSIWAHPDPALLSGIVDLALANSPEFTRESIRSFAESHLNDRLADIKTPALAVTGAADPFLPAAIATMQRLPNATLHVFSGACHLPPAEVPAELATVIDDFVQHGVVTAETVAAAASAS